MKSFLEFIYTDKIVNGKERELIEVADYYRLVPLKAACEDVVFGKISTENAISTLVFADRYNCDNLKLKTLNLIGTHFAEVTQNKGILDLPETLGIDKLDVALVQLIMEAAVLNKLP